MKTKDFETAIDALCCNIDIEEMTITIDHANDYTVNVPKTKKPKSDAGKRVIPMLDRDEKYFMDLIKDLGNDDYLLQMENGKPLTENSYRQLWDSIRRRMDRTAKQLELIIPRDLTSRICRHDYSIRIMNLSDREQMYLMGHEDIAATQVYFGNTKNRIKDVYDRCHPRAK